MAVIEKRGQHQWRARVRRGGIEDSQTFFSRGDAEKWALETEVAISRGNWRDTRAAETPFAKLAEKYLVEVTPSKKSASREKHRIKTLIAAREFRRPIGMIQAAHVAAYRDRRLKEPVRQQRAGAAGRTLSTQTVLHELNSLSSIIEHARKEWSIPLERNAVKEVRKPSRGKARTRRISESELDYLHRAAREAVALSEVIGLAIETTMRLGELLSLRWADVNLEEQELFVREPKNGESRSVALSRSAVGILKGLKSRLKVLGSHDRPSEPRPTPALAAALRRARADGRVFHWAASDSFDKTWRRALKRARDLYEAEREAKGVKQAPEFLVDLRFHDLRHEATSRAFELGLNVMEVASMTGHKSIQQLRRYTHVDARKLAAKLG